MHTATEPFSIQKKNERRKNHRNETRSNDKTQSKSKEDSDTPKTGSNFVELGPWTSGSGQRQPNGQRRWSDRIKRKSIYKKKKQHGQME